MTAALLERSAPLTTTSERPVSAETTTSTGGPRSELLAAPLYSMGLVAVMIYVSAMDVS